MTESEIPQGGQRAASSSLADRVLELIDEGPTPRLLPYEADARFNDLIKAVFAHQFEYNQAYREFCRARSVDPGGVESWRDVPAFPTDAFKSEIVASFPMEEAVMAQITSGTTSASQRGQIFRDEDGRRLVFAANRVMTGAYLFPDLEKGTRCRLLLLAPSPKTAPSMGMAIGMDQTRKHFGTEDSEFLLSRKGLDVRGLMRALSESQDSGVPVAMVGATSAFIYFFRACKNKGIRYALPAGSRISDGGGYRGRFGEATRDDYYELAFEILGVPSSHCVNTLGMAESATNYFDDSLREHLFGKMGERIKRPPQWTRVVAASVDDLSVLPHGEVGLLRHYDLANLPTVLGVQSDNLGYTTEEGFEIVGRAQVRGGRVSELPSERTVGPMGDKRIFRMLEAYTRFAMKFQVGIARSDATSDPRAEANAASESDAVASCPAVVDEMLDTDLSEEGSDYGD